MTTVPSWLFQNLKSTADPFHRGPFTNGSGFSKHWHNQITTCIREHMVEKIKGHLMEEEARKMEEKMFEEAHSRAEYYRMVVRVVKRIRREKRQEEKKMMGGPIRYY
ncbi:hypothetical protein CAEBREN_04573 [Caenorhabditis brenneri]|uniref:Mediator of RNA polymerase II transcription subunit 15 n=1 Tax=Caenorhabditis brenneri TaxID=135651 RepID=G0NEB2_CAEBE|nr:hypothetical protein CAEBREN_04573 [Caenorhabditis brenneri]